MKKINIIIVLFTILNLQCIAHSPIVDLKDRKGVRTTNTYYKDVNNVLNPFVGTWLYTNGNSSLKIVLVKKVMDYDGESYEDVLIGEYQYIENGVEKFNSLADLNTVFQYANYHKIWGNHIPKITRTPFDEEIIGETRFRIFFDDNRSASLDMRKTTVSGQDALQIFKVNLPGEILYGEPQSPASIVPEGFYTLIKQP